MFATLLVILVSATGGAPTDVYVPNEELRAYLIEAAENHPAIRARHQEWLMALQRVPQVTSLDDPMFTLGGFLQSTSSRFKMKVAQKFPWFGTLRVRGERATAYADAALARLEEERDRLYAKVKEAYFEYLYLADQVRVTQSQQEILDYMEDVVRARYSLGMAGQDDLLRLQIEQERLRDRYERLTGMRPALSARLSEALGRSIGDEFPWPQPAALPAPPPDDGTIIRVLRANSPLLHEWDRKLDAIDREIELARKKGYPDFTLGADYTTMSQPADNRPDRPFPATLQGARRLFNAATGRGPFDAATSAIDLYSVGNYDQPISSPISPKDNFLLTLSVNVPLHRKRVKAGIEEAKLKAAAATYSREKTALMLERDARVALFEFEDAIRSVTLYTDSLVPKAAQTFESLQAAYGSGEEGTVFIDLLDSIQALLRLELEQVRLSRDAQQAAAKLEFLIGGPWTDVDGGPAPAGQSGGAPVTVEASDAAQP